MSLERSLLKELNKKNVEAYVNRAREAFLARLFWQLFFGLKYTTQLTWESLTGSSGTPVMADVIEYNASAPLKARRTIAKQSGDIPKIALKRKMDEKDFNDYNTMKALSAGDMNKNALLELVFGDIDFCFTGVHARTEFLCMQALSYGSLSLDATNNNGIITETSVDFGIPAAQKTAVGTIWATAATATPITDIKTVCDAARANGHSIKYIVMDKATFTLMIATTEVKDTWSVFQGMAKNKAVFLSLDRVNAVLEANMLPTIVIVDSAVRFESFDHALSNVAPWKTGYVSFIPEMKVGRLLHGPIAEETAASIRKNALLVKKEHVLLTKWSQVEPFGEYTKGQANAFPVFNDVDSIYILKTNATSWS